jgi:Fe-S cluster assembly protein SufD
MTAAVLAPQDHYRQDFERFRVGRKESAGLAALRRTALERFLALGVPSSRWESWRFTDVSTLAKTRFSRAGDAPVDAARLPPPLGDTGQRLVFVNGRYSPGLSRVESLPKGVIVSSLEEALRTHPAVVEAYLGRLPGLEDHPFTALNTAFWEDGAFVCLPQGAMLEAPLQLVFFASGEQTVNYPRTLIVAEEASQVTIVEDYRGMGAYLSCPVTEIDAADGAVLEHYKVQEEDPRAWHLGGLRLRQGRDSQATLHLLSSSGLLVRTDVVARLDGEGANCTLNGLTLVAGGQLGDQHIRVEHTKPHGTSRQLFKGVLAGKSRTVFDGMIHVCKDAQKTDASQSNRNLLLSRRALANSNPRLEILTDDVKCSHGSTIGFLDPDALFYLRARGIGATQARALLVYAFANDIIERIRLMPLRERLEGLLAERLYTEERQRS